MLNLDARSYKLDCTSAWNSRFAAGIQHSPTPEDIWVADAIFFVEPTTVLLIDRALEDREHSYSRRGFGLIAVYRKDHLALTLDPMLAASLHAGLAQSALTLAKILGGSAEIADNGVSDGIDGWWSAKIHVQTSAQQAEAAVRSIFEGALFRDGALWITAKTCNQTGELRARQCLDQEKLAAFDSGWIIEPSDLSRIEAPKDAANLSGGVAIPTFAFRKVRLRDSLGRVLHPAAVESVGRVLWAEIRPDDRPGVPVGYEIDHRQGDSGLIAVWTRKGIAVACSTDEADQEADRISLRLREIDAVSRQASELQVLLAATRESASSGHDTDDIRHAEERLLESYAALESKASTPEWRLLRRLLSATEHTNIVKALLDHKMAATHLSTSAATAALQTKLEWLELIIVSFYAFEFSHLALEGAFDGVWLWLELAVPVALASSLFLVARYALRNNKPTALLRAVVGLAFLVITSKMIMPHHISPTKELQAELTRAKEELSRDLRRLIDLQSAVSRTTDEDNVGASHEQGSTGPAPSKALNRKAGGGT